MSSRHTLSFTAKPEDIDELGHVNNAVWVQWVQDMATAHWDAVASPEHIAAFAWVVIRHELDYRGNIKVGETVTGETFIPGEPSGAKFDRRVDFRNAQGKVIVSANTTWAMIDRKSGRLMRVRPEVSAPFLIEN